MKISVITVCYNAAQTIERTIRSVIHQTAFDKIEYIIIDGASTDGTVDIVRKHQDKIAVFVSEADSGIYNAMNKGIKIATGDYIHFLNANDFYDNVDVIDEIVKVADGYKADFIIGDVVLVTSDGQKEYRSNKNINAYTLFSDWIYHVTLFAKTDLFRKYGCFDESYKIASDNDWIFPLILDRNIKKAYIEKVIAEFKLDGISAREDSKKQTILELEKVLAKNFRGQNDFLRRILHHKIFNQYSSPLHRICNKIVRKMGLKKLLIKLITKKQDWEIKYCNVN